MLVTNGFIIGFEFRHFDFSESQLIDHSAAGFDRKIKATADAVLLRLMIKGGQQYVLP